VFVGTDRRSAGRTMALRTLWAVGSDRVGASRARFSTPVGTAAFGDAALAQSNRVAGAIEYSFIEPRVWPDSDPPLHPEPSIHFRHQKRTNVAWLDGHVSARPRTFAGAAGETEMGWFGASDDNSVFDYE